MLDCPAEGCKFTAKSDRALTAHVHKCKKAATVLVSIADEVEQREADHRQAKRRRVLSPERLEDVPEVEEPMEVDPEVCLADDRSKNRRLTAVIVLLG